MSSITPHYRTVRQLLQSRSYSIDEYQREYKWGQGNIEELVTDLQTSFAANYRAGDTPKDASAYGEYFLGSIIVTQRGTRSYLVDGQQRVTSLTLLLIHLFRVAQEQGLRVASSIEPLIYSDDYGDEKFNLDITERLPALRALFHGEEFDPDGKDESIQTLVARYRDIEALDLAEDLGGALEPFIYWLLGNVGLIEISTDTDRNAYAIFETMNDRGRPLSPVDMLKAYLLGAIDDADRRAHANQQWKRTIHDLISWGEEPNPERDASFIKAWLRAQYAGTIRERKSGARDQDWELIGTTFHRWVRDHEGRLGVGTGDRNLRVITEEVPFFSRAYRLILDAGATYTPGLEAVYYNAHNQFTWQPTVLLAPLSVHDDDETVRRKIGATAAYLDIWLMRRATNYIMVNYSSVSYAMFLLCQEIRGLALPELVKVLKEKLAQDAEEVSFAGSARKGRRGISDLRVNQFSRRYIYHLLARLTAYVDKESGRPDPFPHLVDRSRNNPWDIEHIWPQDTSQYADQFDSEQEFLEARDHVAGLVLLPADVNRSYQDRPFEEKAPHYAKQNLYAASLTESAYTHQPQFTGFVARSGLEFRPYESFGRAEQLERRELVESLVNRVWAPERLDGFAT